MYTDTACIYVWCLSQLNSWGQFLKKIISPFSDLRHDKTMVAKVFNELKSDSRLKDFSRNQPPVHSSEEFWSQDESQFNLRIWLLPHHTGVITSILLLLLLLLLVLLLLLLLLLLLHNYYSLKDRPTDHNNTVRQYRWSLGTGTVAQ